MHGSNLDALTSGASMSIRTTKPPGSLTTLANLSRLGNAHVREQYNLVRMQDAAVRMTRIITGGWPLSRPSADSSSSRGPTNRIADGYHTCALPC